MTTDAEAHEELLNELVEKWKENLGYTDVDSMFLDNPSNEQILNKCTHGCTLVNYEATSGKPPWRELQEPPDYYRKTRICREHGYARIYVTTGLLALGVGYSLDK